MIEHNYVCGMSRGTNVGGIGYVLGYCDIRANVFPSSMSLCKTKQSGVTESGNCLKNSQTSTELLRNSWE